MWHFQLSCSSRLIDQVMFPVKSNMAIVGSGGPKTEEGDVVY